MIFLQFLGIDVYRGFKSHRDGFMIQVASSSLAGGPSFKSHRDGFMIAIYTATEDVLKSFKSHRDGFMITHTQCGYENSSGFQIP